MQQEEFFFNNNKNNESSNIIIKSNNKSEKDKNNNLCFDKSMSLISDQKDISITPLIEKIFPRENITRKNTTSIYINHNDYNPNFFYENIELMNIPDSSTKKYDSSNSLKNNKNVDLQEVKINQNFFEHKELENNNNVNNPIIKYNDNTSNITYDSYDHKSRDSEYHNNDLISILKKNEFLSNIFLRIKKDNFSLHRGKSDFNINFEFNNKIYRQSTLNKNCQKIQEEKIIGTHISKNNIENQDIFHHLKERLKNEIEEQNKKILIDKINKIKIEKEKILNKKLLGFSQLKIFQILRIIDFFILFLVLSDVSIAVYTNYRFTTREYDLNDRLIKDKFIADININNLRIIMIFLIFFLEISIIIKYYFKLKQFRIRQFAGHNDGIFSSGLYKPLMVEMLILVTFTPPEENELIQGNLLSGEFIYSLDSIILLFKLLKLYYLLYIFSKISGWVDERAKQIARKLKAAVGFNFAVKAGIKNNPILLISFTFLLIFFIFGFVLKIFEYGFTSNPEKIKIYKNLTQKNDVNEIFESYWDVFWLIIITMMTVGYGDFYPQTHIGRFICFLLSVVGMILVGLLIVKLGSIVELSTHEKKALNTIKMNMNLNKIEKKAKELIKGIMKLRMIYIRKKENFKYSKK